MTAEKLLKYILIAAAIDSLVIVVIGLSFSYEFAVLLELICVVTVLVFGIRVIRTIPDDLAGRLRKAAQGTFFETDANRFCAAWEDLQSKERFFADHGVEGEFYKAYSLIERQMKSDIKSAIQYVEANGKAVGRKGSYFVELLDSTESLSEKLSKLTEYTIRLDSIPDDIDMSELDGFLESISAVAEEGTVTQCATKS